MKYVFVDKNTWGYYDGELKMIGECECEVGNIYVCKIQKYDKKLDAFFIEYDKKKIGFLNNTKYTNDLKPSDEVIVQMTKESTEDKYPKFTTKITIQTENLEYTNSNDVIFEGSQKFKNIENFKRKYDFTGVVKNGFFSLTEKEQEKELNLILSKIKFINTEKKFLPIPKLLYKKNPIDKIIQETNLDYLITNEKSIYRQYKSIVNAKYDENYNYNYDNLISRDIIDKNSEIIKLKNNAEIVIQKTEAMWVVDVNSSKMPNSEDYFHELNTNALKKIHQMMYLKKMVGMVIVDCVRQSDYQKLFDFIEEEFCEPNIKFHGFSNLNLLEFTVTLDK
ncbi:ribonuclease E/G [uncultured Finegoldia sp.]|uniref:ribonuclease E/G n=1 Tax=uncultured Finegoldia sp. TaxID=328009 RepID=UPI002619889F|nr:ribonuclease E/G [uncultured Finegoldia sp.]